MPLNLENAIDNARKNGSGVTTEYHVSGDVYILLKARDIVVIKKTEPYSGKIKRAVSWRKKTTTELVEFIANIDWEE